MSTYTIRRPTRVEVSAPTAAREHLLWLTAGLALASVAFGLVHLPYRGFPNWRFVAMTTLLGLICGLVYRRTQGIRAPMVTHALAATTWQLVS